MMRMNRRGFAILEALIASVLFFMAIAIAVMAFMAGSRNFTGSQESIKVCNDCQTIMDMITTELRQAEPGTIAPAPPFSGQTSITFKKYHYPAAPSGQAQTVTWSLQGNRVRRSYSGNNMYLGDNIRNLTFSAIERTDGPSTKLQIVTVTITGQSSVQAGGGTKTIISLTRDAFLRQNQAMDVNITVVPP